MAAFGAPKVTSKSTLAAVASALAASAVAASAPLLAEAAPPPGYARNRERLRDDRAEPEHEDVQSRRHELAVVRVSEQHVGAVHENEHPHVLAARRREDVVVQEQRREGAAGGCDR